MRVQFYDGTWSGIPGTGECYIVPINPYYFDPLDSDDTSWKQGYNLGGRFKRFYDSREREMTWENLAAFPTYITMIETFEGYSGKDSIYVNLGDSLLPGLYATGDDWYQINVTQVTTKIADGKETTYSGGQTYNKFSAITLKFEILGAAE